MADENIERLLQELVNQNKQQSRGATPTAGTGKKDFGTGDMGADFGKAKGYFINALTEGGGSVSNFAKGVGKALPSIPLLDKIGGGAINVIEYMESLQGVFNQLSKVGAGGAADLGDLQRQAGVANLSLDAFANIVGNNADKIVALGGSVDFGKKRFAEMNAAMYDTGMIEQFKMLGYTSQEAAEFMAENLQTTMRSARLSGMTDAQAVEHTASLAKNMQTLAKLSGKDVQSMRDEAIARQRDGATSAAIRLMEMDGATNAAANFQKITSITGDLPAAAQDLIKDVIQLDAPLTDATQNFAAVNQEAFAIAGQIKKAMKANDPAEVERLTKQYSAAVKGFAATREGAQIAVLGQVSDVGRGQAEVLEALKPQVEAIDALLGVQAGQYKTAGELATAYLDNLKKIEAGVKAQADTTVKTPGQEAINFLNTGQIELAKNVGILNKGIGTNITSNTALQLGLKGSTEVLDAISQDFKPILASLSDLAPGMDNTEILKLLEDNIGKNLQGVEVTQELVDQFKQYMDPNSGADQENAFQSLKAANLFDEQGNLKVSVMKIAEDARGGSASTIETEKEAEGLINKILGALNPFNDGTLGSTGNLFQDFGSGSAALLHGLEAVVPKDSAQGQLLSAFPNGLSDVSSNLANLGAKFDPAMMSQTQKELMSAVSAPPSVSRTGETSENSLDNLNQTMLQLVEINRKALSIAGKQLNATKGLDGNVMSSVGL